MNIASVAARRSVVIGGLNHRGVAVLLLLGPCLLYLAAFAIYPLIYSLKLSLTDLQAAEAHGRWIGLRNYGDLLRDPFFWNATRNSAIMVTASVTIQVDGWSASSLSQGRATWELQLTPLSK